MPSWSSLWRGRAAGRQERGELGGVREAVRARRQDVVEARRSRSSRTAQAVAQPERLPAATRALRAPIAIATLTPTAHASSIRTPAFVCNLLARAVASLVRRARCDTPRGEDRVGLVQRWRRRAGRPPRDGDRERAPRVEEEGQRADGTPRRRCAARRGSARGRWRRARRRTAWALASVGTAATAASRRVEERRAAMPHAPVSAPPAASSASALEHLLGRELAVAGRARRPHRSRGVRRWRGRGEQHARPPAGLPSPGSCPWARTSPPTSTSATRSQPSCAHASSSAAATAGGAGVRVDEDRALAEHAGHVGLGEAEAAGPARVWARRARRRRSGAPRRRSRRAGAGPGAGRRPAAPRSAPPTTADGAERSARSATTSAPTTSPPPPMPMHRTREASLNVWSRLRVEPPVLLREREASRPPRSRRSPRRRARTRRRTARACPRTAGRAAAPATSGSPVLVA